MKTFRASWLAVAYYLTWLWFGLGGLLLNLVCAPLLLVPGRARLGPPTRRVIRWMFDFWLRWMHASGVLRVHWVGFDQPLPAGAVYVANHPTLLDAPCLLSRLPGAVCIFKPALLRNPLVAPAAILAGYVAGEHGVDVIRAAAAGVAAGQALLIFPEGTRTPPGQALLPLKPGFALIARRAHAPVHIIRVRASAGLAGKGTAWWRLPPLPAWLEFTQVERLAPEQLGNPAEVSEYLAKQLQPAQPAATSPFAP